MKQSGLLKRQKQEINTYANAWQQTIQQFDIDTLCIAINRYESFGYKRIMRLLAAWEKVRMEFYPAINPNDPECDVKQEHMDRVFAKICENHTRPIPSHERYPNLRSVSYEGRKAK